MLFSEILNSMRQADGVWTATASEDWLQGRSLFGGLQAAMALKAMRGLVPQGVPLRTLQVTFLSPVPAGTVRARAQVLRAGKNATHVEGRLVDASGQTLCLCIGIFGAARSSVISIVPRQPAAEGQPRPFPFIKGVTPDFTQHFAMRWRRGGMPFTGASLAENVLELDMRDGEAATIEEHVLAIADVIPPVALSLLKTPVPGSSMTWMLEMLHDQLAQLPLQGWRMDAEVVAAGGGYTSQSGLLWGPGGVPVALSRQNMVIFG
jgi:hypothetical protein